MHKFSLATLGILLATLNSQAADAPLDPLDNWHQWRGPLANGFVPRGKPPLKWDDKTNIKWRTPIPGRGTSTPIIWGDQIFLLTVIDTGKKADAKDIPAEDTRFKKKTTPPTTYHQFVVLALSRKTGKVLWQRIARECVPHEGHHPTHSYAAYSPVTDGKHLYVSFGSRGIYCYDLAGTLQWKRDLGRMETRLGWGEGTSPALHRDTLILNWDHEDKSFITTLDAKTGKPKWKVDRNEVTSWATPAVVEYKGKTQVIVPATKRVRSYDLATGKVLWQWGGLTVNCIPSPVVRDGVVICMSGYQGSAAAAIPLGVSGDVTGSAKILWTHDRGTPYVPSPLLAGDRLYFTHVNDPRLTCLDARTGKAIIDRVRLPGLRSLYASPIAAAGRIYLPDRDGTTLVFEQADKLKVLATNRLSDPIDASPVVVGKQLFLRGEKYLYCIEE
jgi:outer membrane protein assembly factor BamB